jgi:hypothetical protein
VEPHVPVWAVEESSENMEVVEVAEDDSEMMHSEGEWEDEDEEEEQKEPTVELKDSFDFSKNIYNINK